MLGLAYPVSLFLAGLLILFAGRSLGAALAVVAFIFLGLIGAVIFAIAAIVSAFTRRSKARAGYRAPAYTSSGRGARLPPAPSGGLDSRSLETPTSLARRGSSSSRAFPSI